MPDDDYEVGYGRPPKRSQWKKGQSGNARGRPRGSRGLKADLHDQLNEKLTISMSGKQVKDTTQRLMLRTLAARAASGNIQATRLLIETIMQVFGADDRGGEAGRLSSQDQELLARYLDRIGDNQDALSSSAVEPNLSEHEQDANADRPGADGPDDV